jgi:hypothetical protein
MRTVCFTSFTFGYLARARVLAATLRAAHPAWEIVALIVDDPPPALPAEALAPFDRVVYAETLPIAGFRGWLFKHDLVEACTAVKGTMLARLLAEGAERVVYLDPDTAIFHPLDDLDGALAGASVVLTPHQTEPNTEERMFRDNERTSLRYGIYNLGFISVRNDASGRAFAAWWAELTHRACYDEPANGIFTDQKYCDLAPGLFDGVAILRDPGWNVASWNLSRRRLAVAPDGAILVNGAKLRFYHFTKIGGVGDLMTERYAGDNLEVYELVTWYKRAVARETFPAAEAWPWRFGRFASGEEIPRAARLLWRERADLVAAFADPFAAGPGTYRGWIARERPDLMALAEAA